jgi:two-component system, response regulator
MGDKKFVLIVDDDPSDALLTKRVLTKLSHNIKVEIACSGEEALGRLRTGETLPTLILLDLKMPGMSGLDMLRKARADEQLREIPVVVVSSSSLEADEKASYAAGADGFLHKKFDLDEFTHGMKSLLKRLLKD